MDLGIFDHLDRRDMPVADFYEHRLRLLEKYDAAGFYSYHLAEHHATPLGLAPMPGIFLAAATQRTRRIRLGPCVYCLPLYNPLRLIEEVCMLDHLSRGRFDFGVGRGIVPYEMAFFDLHHLETEDIYRETLEIVLQGLTSDVLDHRGAKYTYRKVPMILRPLQQPHPPLWYGLGHTAGAEWAATNRVNVITNLPAEAVGAAVRPLSRGVAAQARGRADAEARHGPPRGGRADRGRGDGARPGQLCGLVRQPHQALARLRRGSRSVSRPTSTRRAAAGSPSRARRPRSARSSSARWPRAAAPT